MIVPIILSGGSGTRLWPLSRKLHPKQFISLVNDTSLFQDTILRLPDTVTEPLIICNEDHRFLAAEQLREINRNNKGIILEPEGKNTAPAVALGAIRLLQGNENPIILVLSADHLIKDNNAFHKAIEIGSALAEKEKLVTFGVVPDRAETGYGYINTEKNSSDDHYNIKSFTEKPNQENAKKYLDSGHYLWNSGMFMFKASTYLNELDKFENQMLDACKKSCKAPNIDADFIRIDSNEFNQCPSNSIDYAVMERTKNGVVVPLDANWSDVGSWSSLWGVKTKDSHGNVSEGDVTLKDVENTYAYSSSRLVSAIGVSNLVIVDTQDALLVADKGQVHNIKSIIEALKNNERSEIDSHRKVYRPWGYYDSIDYGECFQVKRIVVNSGAKLSLQKHRHRSEHWVVVNGVAHVTCGEETFELQKNQSTYIPKGEIHRLENRKEHVLEIIEIQTGSYLGEDDIIRLEDDYSRS